MKKWQALALGVLISARLVLADGFSGGGGSGAGPPGPTGPKGDGVSQRVTVAGCVTASICAQAPVTVTWPVAFADTSYTVDCTCIASSGERLGAAHVISQTAAHVVVQTTPTDIVVVPGSSCTIECTGIHP